MRYDGHVNDGHDCCYFSGRFTTTTQMANTTELLVLS